MATKWVFMYPLMWSGVRGSLWSAQSLMSFPPTNARFKCTGLKTDFNNDHNRSKRRKCGMCHMQIICINHVVYFRWKTNEKLCLMWFISVKKMQKLCTSAASLYCCIVKQALLNQKQCIFLLCQSSDRSFFNKGSKIYTYGNLFTTKW